MCLPSVWFLPHGKRTCLPCAKLSPCVSSTGSRQRSKDAVCLEFAVRFGEWHTAKNSFAVCLSFAVCCFGLHTANTTFAGCPRFSPRQISGHTTNARFPVVRAYLTNYHNQRLIWVMMMPGFYLWHLQSPASKFSSIFNYSKKIIYFQAMNHNHWIYIWWLYDIFNL